MYKKAILALTVGYLLLLTCMLWEERTVAEKTIYEKEGPVESHYNMGMARVTASDRRIVNCQTLAKNLQEEEGETGFAQKEIEILQRIVEAEAGGEDQEGKILVANVVLNRVKSEDFPNTIAEVVFQSSNGVTQFSPVANGSYDRIQVSEASILAVDRALQGEDLSEGALFFAARKYANAKSMKWFDENLTFLFRHGGHEFFK